MEKIQDVELIKEPDAKDRTILKELFRNARAPFSEIAKKTRLTKESVAYRVNRLLDNGLLTGFNAVLDIKKMGWEIFFVYVRFRNIDIEREEEILTKLKEHKNVAWLVKCIGNYDVIIKLFVKSQAEVDTILKELESEFETNFDTHIIDTILEERAIPYIFRYELKENVDIDQKTGHTEHKFKVDNTDLLILKSLANNARFPLSELSKKIKISRDTVKYRLKQLEHNGIVIKYRPDLWPKKLGYNWYFIILKVGKLDGKTKNALEEYISAHTNVSYFYNTIGSSDMQIEIKIKTTVQLNQFLMDVRGILKKVLKRHELLTILTEYKYTYFPECLMETNS